MLLLFHSSIIIFPFEFLHANMVLLPTNSGCCCQYCTFNIFNGFVVNGFEIFNRLHINEIDAVSGKFGDFAKTYQEMGDLDSRNAAGQ